MQIEQTFTSLPASVEPLMGAWDSGEFSPFNLADTKSMCVLMYIWTQSLRLYDSDPVSRHPSILLSLLAAVKDWLRPG